MNKIINWALNSQLVFNLSGWCLTSALVLIFSEYWAMVCLIVGFGMTFFGALLHRVPLYVTHYAPTEAIPSILSKGFFKPTQETDNFDFPEILLGQQRRDLVSFVAVNDKAVLSARTRIDKIDAEDYTPISMWVSKYDSFFSTMTVHFFGLVDAHGTIIEVVVGRQLVNEKLKAGEYSTRTPNKNARMLSAIISGVANICYPGRMTIKSYVAGVEVQLGLSK